MGRRSDLIGGGLIRSVGVWKALNAFSKLKIHIKGDEGTLGDSDFVESVVEGQNKRYARRFQLQAQGADFAKILDRAAKIFNLKPGQVLSSAKQPQHVSDAGKPG